MATLILKIYDTIGRVESIKNITGWLAVKHVICVQQPARGKYAWILTIAGKLLALVTLLRIHTY